MTTKMERLQQQLLEYQEKAKAAKAALDQLRKEQDRQARIAVRKARTRQLIEAGGLVEIAALLTTDKGTLLGALMEVRKNLENPEKATAWKCSGDAELDSRAAQKKGRTEK